VWVARPNMKTELPITDEKKDKSRTVRSLPLFLVVVHCHVVYLCHETASMFTCAQLDRAEARASTCVPFIFNLRFKSRRVPATRVDVVLANIDSEKRRTMALIFCFQWPLCQPQSRTATERLLSTPANPRRPERPTFLRPSSRASSLAH